MNPILLQRKDTYTDTVIWYSRRPCYPSCAKVKHHTSTQVRLGHCEPVQILNLMKWGRNSWFWGGGAGSVWSSDFLKDPCFLCGFSPLVQTQSVSVIWYWSLCAWGYNFHHTYCSSSKNPVSVFKCLTGACHFFSSWVSQCLSAGGVVLLLCRGGFCSRMALQVDRIVCWQKVSLQHRIWTKQHLSK